MTGIAQNKQKSLIFIVVSSKKNERLGGGGKKFIRSHSKGKVFK